MGLDSKTIQEITKFNKDYFKQQNQNRGINRDIKTNTNTIDI